MALILMQESLNMASESYFFKYLQETLPELVIEVGTTRNNNARKRMLAPYKSVECGEGGHPTPSFPDLDYGCEQGLVNLPGSQ